jgi:hypothetical protein
VLHYRTLQRTLNLSDQAIFQVKALSIGLRRRTVIDQSILWVVVVLAE